MSWQQCIYQVIKKSYILFQNHQKQIQQNWNTSILKNPINNNCRYFESGFCTGLFPIMCEFLHEKCPEMRSCTVYPWRVYAKTDIKMYSTRHPNTTSIPKQYKRKVLSTEQNFHKSATTWVKNKAVESLLSSICS